MANRSFLDTITEATFRDTPENPCMVIVPEDLFVKIQAWKSRIGEYNTKVATTANADLKRAFQEALDQGKVYTFSLSRKKYARPIAVVAVNVYEDLIVFEVRHNEDRNFLLSAVCSSKQLPEFQ